MALKKQAYACLDGRGDTIRTCDLFVPNEALYQAEAHPVICNMTNVAQTDR